MPDTRFCPNCGERISARARFCPSCGASQDAYRVDEGESAPRVPPPPPGGDALWSAGGPVAPPPAARPAAEPATSAEPIAPAVPAEPAPVPADPAPAERVDRAPAEPADPGPVPADPAPADPVALEPADPTPPGQAPPAPGAAADPAPVSPAPAAPEPTRDGPPTVEPPRAPAAAGTVRDGLAGAATAAGISAGVVLLAGLVLALVTPDNSIVGAVGIDAGLLTETFRQAIGTLLTAMVDEPGLLVSGTRRIHPLLLVAIPLGALVLSTRAQLGRSAGAGSLARYGWAALVGVPFGLLMALFALIGGDSDTTRIAAPPGNAFALGLLWGVVGGLIAAATVVPAPSLPAARPRAVAGAVLRPLAVVLAVCTVVGTAGWLIQVGRDAGGVRAGRSAATALVEEAAFAGEHGIGLTALAAGARFTADADGALGLPFPVSDPDAVPGRDGAFRSFDYEGTLPGAVFVLALIGLIGLVTLAALTAGFAAARAAGARSLRAGLAWGAVTGPVWAVAMALLVVLAGGLFHGDADDASVFLIFLLGGGALGAAGGALAASVDASERHGSGN